MNSIQRRVLRAFVESGGDLAEPVQVERLVRYVETSVALLPPKVRASVEMAWACPQVLDYDAIARELSVREQLNVTNLAVRQRVSRGLRLLEGLIRRRSWDCEAQRI